MDVLHHAQDFPPPFLGKKDGEALVGVGVLVGEQVINRDHPWSEEEVGLRTGGAVIFSLYFSWVRNTSSAGFLTYNGESVWMTRTSNTAVLPRAQNLKEDMSPMRSGPTSPVVPSAVSDTRPLFSWGRSRM